jgi:hypothetical protein
LFAWRKAARAGLLSLPADEAPLFVPVVTQPRQQGATAAVVDRWPRLDQRAERLDPEVRRQDRRAHHIAERRHHARDQAKPAAAAEGDQDPDRHVHQAGEDRDRRNQRGRESVRAQNAGGSRIGRADSKSRRRVEKIGDGFFRLFPNKRLALGSEPSACLKGG